MLWVIGVACAVVALGVLLWVWADAIEPRLFRIRRVSLCAADLGLPAMRILHITDTHLHGGDGAILSFLRDLAAREQFDLVCYTGDLVHNDGGVPSLATVAGLFSPRLGSFAVLGGHDYADIPSRSIARRLLAGPDPISSHPPNAIDGVIQALETQGVCLLQDGHERVRAPDGSELAIVGLGDTYVATPDVASAWDGLSDQVPVILVAHSPDVLPDVAGRGARLALFGHTHGGQVRFPLIGALVTRSNLPRRAARGTFRTDGTAFIVNAGLGQAPDLSIRFLCRPEVVIVELADEGSPVAALEEVPVG